MESLQYVHRVNQFEAEIFDDYVISQILEISCSSLNYSEFAVIKKYFNEIQLSLKGLYLLVLLLRDKVTLGQLVYNIKFKSLDVFKTIAYVFLKLGIPYLINKIDDYLLKHDVSTANQNRLGGTFNKNITIFLRFLTVFYRKLEMITFIQFLFTNKHHSLVNKILNLDYQNINPSNQSSFSYNFILKKIIWGQISKIIIFFFTFSPAGNTSLQSLFSKLGTILSERTVEEETRKSGGLSICSICGEDMTMPCIAPSCMHTFCYFCISRHMRESDQCPVCFKVIDPTGFQNALDFQG